MSETKPVLYSALEVAKLCGVVNQTTINWIKNNQLKAFKTPGGQFRVYPEDLLVFMRSRNLKIPPELRAACNNGAAVSQSLLIVDADRGLNSVIARFVKKRVVSLAVFQAFDGFEAGSLMAEKQPGIVLLDLDLPGIDGFDLCRRINESERFGKPVIVVITALGNDEIESKLRELGVHSFMKKPLDLVKLAATINEILGK